MPTRTRDTGRICPIFTEQWQHEQELAEENRKRDAQRLADAADVHHGFVVLDACIVVSIVSFFIYSSLTTTTAAWPSAPSAPSFYDSSNNSSAITLAPPSLSAIPVSSTPAGGMTLYLKLKDHSVLWSQTLDPILKFDIDRETTQILPNPLKLVVIQRINHEGPHGSPQNPRLGVVYLNFTEYIIQGNVECRYLLKESKTNATLKVF